MAAIQRILIVDDEPEFVGELQRRLEERTFKVCNADCRSSAMESVKSESPGVVVIGTITPRGDAYRLQKDLKQNPRLSHLPILVVDAPFEKRHVKGWMLDEVRMLEAEDYVMKPVEPSALVSRIERLMQRAATKIRVLVVDDHTILRDGICAMLSLHRDIEVVGQAVNGREACQKVAELGPDVVVMDLMMPEMTGLQATKVICEKSPQTKVLILTQYDEQENVLTTTKAGACGFIPKKAAATELVTGIRSVHSGGYFLDSVAAKAFIEAQRKASQPQASG